MHNSATTGKTGSSHAQRSLSDRQQSGRSTTAWHAFVLRAAALLIIAGSMSVAPAAHAQVSITSGFKGGVHSADLRADDLAEALEIPDEFTERRRGMAVGGFVQIDFAGPFALQPEAAYVQKGFDIPNIPNDPNVEAGSLALDYVEIPILAKLQIPVAGPITPTVFAGPAVSVNVNAEFDEPRAGTDPRDISDFVSGTEVGAHVGAGLDIEAGVVLLMLDARYTRGLTGVFDEDEINDAASDITNEGFRISLGIGF